MCFSGGPGKKRWIRRKTVLHAEESDENSWKKEQRLC